MIGEGLQGALGHRVHRERRGKCPDIQDVGRAGVLGAVLAHSRRCGRAPGVEDALPARGAEQGAYALYVRFAIAMPSWLWSASGTLRATAASHRPDEPRRPSRLRLEPRDHPSLDATQEASAAASTARARTEASH